MLQGVCGGYSMSETAAMNGAEWLARALAGTGLSHVFFVESTLRRTLLHLRELGVRPILAHSEKAAAYMADGYARVSGRPGVCMAQSVGAANLASGMQDPYLGHSPVIAFSGRHVAASQYRNAYQEAPHEPLYQSVTKWQGRVDVLEQIPHVLRQAFREATTGTPRPVHVDMAGYTGDAVTGDEGTFEVIADEAHKRFPAFRPGPD